MNTTVRLNFTENRAMFDIYRPYGTSVNRGVLFILPIFSPYGTAPLGAVYW